MKGILPLFAGRGMSRWRTLEEAEASWNYKGHLDNIPRSEFRFWKKEGKLTEFQFWLLLVIIAELSSIAAILLLR